VNIPHLASSVSPRFNLDEAKRQLIFSKRLLIISAKRPTTVEALSERSQRGVLEFNECDAGKNPTANAEPKESQDCG
jgi:hypothetical protein